MAEETFPFGINPEIDPDTGLPVFNTRVNQQIAEGLGFQGTAGTGEVSQFLLDNPHLIDQFEEIRQRFQPDFSAEGLRSLVGSGTSITDLVADQALSPDLPPGTDFQAILQNIEPDELLTGPQLGTLTADQTAAQQAAQVDPTAIVEGIQAQQITGTGTTAVDPLVAAELQVRAEATVAGQLQNLFGDFENGEVPQWAINAFSAAKGELAGRGLSNSSIAAGAITQAFLQSALPIASADAATYFQADLANFNAENQANLVNFQARQQNMLTDVSIANATEQFNAASAQQTQQFIASLITQIQTQNADRLERVEGANLNREQEINLFNANLQHQRDIFNATTQFAINQSNVVWRRNVNTGNTAAINASMQANVQNRFNMSQTAVNNIWQQFRDEAAWAFESAENQTDRDYNLAIAGINRDFLSRNDDRDLGIALGSMVIDFLVGLDLF